MDIVTHVTLIVDKNDRTYRFDMPAGAPFGECYDAAFECLGKIAEMAKKAADDAQAKPADSSPTQVEAILN